MKKAVSLLAFLALVGAVWFGAGLYLGAKTEKALVDASLTSCLESKNGWRVTDLRHSRGSLNSGGKLTLSSCAANGSVPTLKAAATYFIDHLPLTSGAIRFTFDLIPADDANEDFKSVFGSTAAAHGVGRINYSGDTHVDWNLPPVALRKRGETVDITAPKGSLDIKGDQISFTGAIDRAVFRGKREAIDVKGLSIDITSTNPSLGTGSGVIKINAADTNLGSLKDLEVSARSIENGDRIDTEVTYALGKVEALGDEYVDTKATIAINGLHSKSVASLLKLFKESNGFAEITPAEKKAVAQDVEGLLSRGFSLGAPTIQTKNNKGAVRGKFVVTLASETENRKVLASRVAFSGDAEFKGTILPEELARNLVRDGIALRNADVLSSRYEYANGVFKVNDRPWGKFDFDSALNKLDQAIQSLLAELQS